MTAAATQEQRRHTRIVATLGPATDPPGVLEDLFRAERIVLTNALRGVLEAQVQGREGATPFAWWAGRFGLWPLWALALGAVAVVARRRTSN